LLRIHGFDDITINELDMLLQQFRLIVEKFWEALELVH
jgi:hypothetical protein